MRQIFKILSVSDRMSSCHAIYYTNNDNLLCSQQQKDERMDTIAYPLSTASPIWE